MEPATTAAHFLDGYNAPGTRNKDFYIWDKPVTSSNELIDCRHPLELEEKLQCLLRSGPEKYNTLAPKTFPNEDSKNLWQYENLRVIVRDLNKLIGTLNMRCTRQSCPEMKATDEWVFLCAAHKQPKECCAYEYMVHTLDSTNHLLCNQSLFPSRTQIPASSSQYFSSIARRLYRIFSHTYFHHRTLFDAFEAKTLLCHRFVRFSIDQNLIPTNLLIIPNMD